MAQAWVRKAGRSQWNRRRKGLDAHLHVLGFEDDAVRTLSYAPQDAVLLHGAQPLPWHRILPRYPAPRSRPRRGCLATARKLAPGPGGRGQLGIVSGPLSAFP